MDFNGVTVRNVDLQRLPDPGRQIVHLRTATWWVVVLVRLQTQKCWFPTLSRSLCLLFRSDNPRIGALIMSPDLIVIQASMICQI